jgi:hypothetical protein
MRFWAQKWLRVKSPRGEFPASRATMWGTPQYEVPRRQTHLDTRAVRSPFTPNITGAIRNGLKVKFERTRRTSYAVRKFLNFLSVVCVRRRLAEIRSYARANSNPVLAYTSWRTSWNLMYTSSREITNMYPVVRCSPGISCVRKVMKTIL